MEHKLTNKQEKLLELLADPEYAKNPRQALKDAGYSDKSDLYNVLKGIKEEILGRADNYLLLHALGCIDAIVDVRNNPDQKGAKAKLEASNMVLDKIGIVKKDKLEVDVKAASGVLIIPQKKET